MVSEKGMVPKSESALSLPEAGQLRSELEAIRRFQQIVHQELTEGHDYGVIPGTQKPTLYKPGAEKITKLLGLADRYEIVSEVEDWAKPFFAYKIRAILSRFGTENIVSEGLGECNSLEARYRWRWLWPDEVPEGMDKTKLVSRKVANGGKQYRIENDDVYSLVNTLLKMAEKRALVDAALHAGRLSDVFTQDIEDMPEEAVEVKYGGKSAPPDSDTPVCPDHKKPMTKGQYGWYCKTKVGDGWCKYKPPTEAEVQHDADTLFGSEAKVVIAPEAALRETSGPGASPTVTGELPAEITDWVKFRKFGETKGVKISEVALKLGRRYVSLALDERTPIEPTPENLSLAWAALQEIKAGKVKEAKT